MLHSPNIAPWIVRMIEETVAASPENTLALSTGEPAFDRPLVGFSSGADSLYAEYMRHIGTFYLTPLKILQTAFPDAAFHDPEAVSVISWILPSTSATRREQSHAVGHPSERWARTRLYGERFNDVLRQHVVNRLSQEGIPAVAPVLTSFWSRSDQGPYAPCSNWSERHAAFAAGLGTFGLCDGLITPLGKAMRTGSVVAGIALPPTPRPYTDIHAHCLHYSHGTCSKCIPRCPVDALGHDGHDKARCIQYTEKTMNTFMKETYHLETYACGLCQAAVPCMDHIPGPEEGG
ncbi:MAG: epoxyqueuosine reductase [Deltaproteobacteria bacterium]|nr:epoxyqueuosine reductase [Deltaproteobacteria bacterium]MBW2131560.1 epoxyqueuosine reductase [Deltaproteobacteria bacterium]